MATKNKNTKVITGKVRLSYAHVWEPVSINGGEEKYSVSLIIPKSDTKTVKDIQAAVDAAIDAGLGKFGGKKPNKGAIKLPLRDGDVERPDDENYKDAYFINALRSMHSTPTGTRASPADSGTSRNSRMANPSAGVHRQHRILRALTAMTRISSADQSDFAGMGGGASRCLFLWEKRYEVHQYRC